MHEDKPEISALSELESRIVAFILDEASDFEKAQLKSLCSADPSSDRFKESVQRVHELLLAVSIVDLFDGFTGDGSKEDLDSVQDTDFAKRVLRQLTTNLVDPRENSDARLSPERRAKILSLCKESEERLPQTLMGDVQRKIGKDGTLSVVKRKLGGWSSRFPKKSWTDGSGEWFGRRRVLFASLTGLCLFGLSYLMFRPVTSRMVSSDSAAPSGRWFSATPEATAGKPDFAPDDMSFDEAAEWGAEKEDASIGLGIAGPGIAGLGIADADEEVFDAESPSAFNSRSSERLSISPPVTAAPSALPAPPSGAEEDFGTPSSKSANQPSLPSSGPEAAFGAKVMEVERLDEKNKSLDFKQSAPSSSLSKASDRSRAPTEQQESFPGQANSPQSQVQDSPALVDQESLLAESDSVPRQELNVDFFFDGGLEGERGLGLEQGLDLNDNGIISGELLENELEAELDAGNGDLGGMGGMGMDSESKAISGGLLGGFGGGGGMMGGGGFGGQVQNQRATADALDKSLPQRNSRESSSISGNTATPTPRFGLPTGGTQVGMADRAGEPFLEEQATQGRQTGRQLVEGKTQQLKESEESIVASEGRQLAQRGEELRQQQKQSQLMSRSGIESLAEMAPVDQDADGLIESTRKASSKESSGIESRSRVAGERSSGREADQKVDRLSEIVEHSGKLETAEKAKKRLLGRDAKENLQLAPIQSELDPSKIKDAFKELQASETPFSTFSLHVSDVSFKLAKSALAQGQWPDVSRVRIEEFVNALDYGDPMPTQNERVACQVEQAIHPFLQQRNLVRISMRTAATGRASSTPLKLTFVLDNSGSMERLDRRQTVRRAFQVLASQLQEQDEVTLISFASQTRLLADRMPGKQAAEVLRLLDRLPSEGGTNLEEALRLASEKAREQFTPGAQNRVVLITDGAVNLGDANPESLAGLVIAMRDSGIAFDAAGIGADGLNDEVLEALTRKGDGRYYLLDSKESVEDGFAQQIAGALRPAAKNVKVQVEFNPQRVEMYKLLGFEKHRLKKEDFRNDKVDAAEMAAAEAGVAVYQVQVKPDGYGDLGSVAVRFRDLKSGRMVEERWPITFDANVPRIDLAPSSMKLAAVSSLFAMRLKGDERSETVDLRILREILSTLPPSKYEDPRVMGLLQMVEQARQMGDNSVQP